MKKTALLLLVLLAGFAACKKEEEKKTTPTTEAYKCATCPTASEANPAYDANSAGVYKGVIVGSTGTIALYLYNTGTEVKALVTFDGKNGTLTNTTLSASWTPGQAINAALFTGVVDGKNIQALFTVGANGANPTVDVQIPGHTVVVALYKETSATLIKNFEGTYAGGDQGIFNMTLSGNDFSIVTDDGDDIIRGTLVNGKIDLSNGNGVTIKGEFSGDEVNGTWSDSNGKSGTWTGKRTL